MPAGGAVATGVAGDDVIDLGVCIKLLKKSIVLIPLFIMLVIFLIRVTLTHEKVTVKAEVSAALNASFENSTASASDVGVVEGEGDDDDAGGGGHQGVGEDDGDVVVVHDDATGLPDELAGSDVKSCAQKTLRIGRTFLLWPLASLLVGRGVRRRFT